MQEVKQDSIIKKWVADSHREWIILTVVLRADARQQAAELSNRDGSTTQTPTFESKTTI